MTRLYPKLTFWRAVFWFLMAAGVYAAYVRIFDGLGGSTNLTDEFPWGIWVGFDVLCGVGLAAGGFTLAATVHIFNVKKYEPIVRPAILTAFLGYLLVVVALMFDLGRPYRIWHPIIMWNPHSVMFEVGWCVTLYSTVLFLEFVPVVLERFRMYTALKYMKSIMLPVVVAGVILSTLHQSSLGTLYLIVPTKLYALWYTPLLPVLFYVSAIAAGLAMTIFESWHSSKAFGRKLEKPLLMGLGRTLAVMLTFYLALRFWDMAKRGALSVLNQNRIETWLFATEILLMAIPMVLLFQVGIRRNPRALYTCAVLTLLGFVANRLNVGIAGMEAGSGVHYFPKWTEVAVTLAIIAAGFAAFQMAVKHLPIFEGHEDDKFAPADQEELALMGIKGD